MRLVRKLSRRDVMRLSALAALSAGAVACGGSTPAPAAPATPVEGETPPPAASAEKVIIRWQDWPDFANDIDRVLSMAEDAIPGIEVEFEPLGDNWVEKTLAAMVAGTAPDVFTAWEPEFSKFYGKGQLLDLQPLVDRDLTAEDIADFHPWQWAGMVSYDKSIRFGMPYYVNLIFLYYSKAAYDEAGEPYPTRDLDMDSYAMMLNRLVKKEEDKIVRWGGEIPLWYNWLTVHVHAYGGYMVNPDDWTECWLGKDEALAAMEWIRARIWDDNSLAQTAQLQGVGDLQGGVQGPWAAGMIASKEDGMGNLSYFASESKFDWDIMHLPKGPAKRTTLGTTDGWGIAKGTKHPEEAWQFLNWLAGPDFQTVMMEAWAGIPNRNSLITKWKEIARASYPSLENVTLDVVTETLDEGYPMLSDQFKKHAESEALIAAAFEKIFQVGDTPVDYLKEIADQVTALNREE